MRNSVIVEQQLQLCRSHEWQDSSWVIFASGDNNRAKPI